MKPTTYCIFAVLSLVVAGVRADEDIGALIDQIFANAPTVVTSSVPGHTSVKPTPAPVKPDNGACKCVPYYLCQDTSEGIIDINGGGGEDTCESYLEVCCTKMVDPEEIMKMTSKKN